MKLSRSFQLLGLVKEESSISDIKRAYITLAKKYHPDAVSSKTSNTDQFIKVN